MRVEQKKTIIIARVIGSLLHSYEDKEKTAIHKKIEARVQKGFNGQIKKHRVDKVKVAVDIGKELWFATIDHFSKEAYTIEASNMILRLLERDTKALGKQYGLNKGIMGKWAKPMKKSDAAEIEARTKEIVEYLMNLINERLGIVEEKKIGLMERIKASKETI